MQRLGDGGTQGIRSRVRKTIRREEGERKEKRRLTLSGRWGSEGVMGG